MKKLFFDQVRTQNKPPGKSSLPVLVPCRNRSGVVELVGREPLIIARVENGVTKFSPQRQKTPKFSKKNGSGKQLVTVASILWVNTQTQLFFQKENGSGKQLVTVASILWVTTQTQLFLTPPKKSLAGESPKLFRENNYEKTRFV